MFNRQTWTVLLMATLFAAAGGWLQHRSRLARVPAGVHVTAIGEVAPDLALMGTDGRQHRLSDYRGKRVLLNFWASWCGPCLEEMPALAQAAREHAGSATVVGVAMDNPDRARAFLAAHPVDYPILLGELASPSTSLRFGDTAQVLPYSALLGPDGRLLATRRGPLDAATLARWLSGRPVP
ncbi:MAG: TlpA family protein disulfide reductase [Xanthomonadaceae bacterium]|nr:TlpA family protein disulfide reductase [Xanthomonadaceae bacterium]MDE1963920.1 TlpA family protein disulfide reductase [Xanthomonadaceae bacterium]